MMDGSSSGDENEDVISDSDSDTSSSTDINDDSEQSGIGVNNDTETRQDNVERLDSEVKIENEEDDDVLKALMRERTKCREHPPDIHSDDFVVDISFHPEENIIAAATITGDVILHKYTNESTEVINTLEVHTKACRAVEFSKDGNTLFSTSKDKSIVLCDVNIGRMKLFYDNAHENPLYCLLILDENRIASGDDNGVVKLWDLRKKDPIWSLKEMDDYVSCMISTEAKKYLVCASGDGTITSIDIGARKLHIQSEMYEEELTCIGTMRSETKLLVGSSKGIFYLFNWGEFGYHSDAFPGPKLAINCLLPVTENIAVCAGEDGALRATHFFPHRHLGVVGQHQFSVESLDISGSGELIASCSHDQTIKFWNIKYFEDIQVDGKKKAKKKEVNHNLPSSKCSNASDFFSELY
ncbi:WD repeat-containing protein 55 homolog isoform X2 [Periplaneta americana]